MNELEIRELVETLRRRGLSRPAALGHHSGVNDEAADVIESLLAKLQDGRTYIVTEVCPHCESEIEMRWDTDALGFKAFCPVCGERLMLCDECQHSGPDGGPTWPCDYDGTTDTCRFNRSGGGNE